MRKLLPVLIVMFCCALLFGLLACTAGPQAGDSPPIGEAVQQLAEQMPGVLDSINSIVQDEPLVGQEVKDHVAGYTAMAKDASQIVDGLAGVKSPEQLSGALAAVANLAKDARLPADTMSQVNNYLGWGTFLLKVAGVVVPLVVHSGGLTPPIA